MFIIHARIVLTGNLVPCEYIDKQSVTSMPLLDYLVKSKMVKFPSHRHELSFD